MTSPRLWLAIFALSACSTQAVHQENRPGKPPWLQQKIQTFSTAPPADPPRAIIAYSYQMDTVYYITQPCCDQMNKVFSREGELICHPDGGITGKGDGRCPDFREEAKQLFVVWEDERNTQK